MESSSLGETGIKVSKMCFGVLTIGPLQANLPLQEGASVIRHALEMGVNFLDTAQFYRTYPYIKEALRGFPGEVVVASKSYAYTRDMMSDSIEEARKSLDRDVIDIFMLHEQESELTIRGHWEAYEYLLECREKGIIRAAGISTHHVAGVEAAARNPHIDVIHPLYNSKGIGIVDGTAADMGKAIALAFAAGKGIYGMKALGGGNLLSDTVEAFSFVLNNPNLHSVAVGMKTIAEVDMNIRIFSGQEVPPDLIDKVNSIPRSLFIEEYCSGCGSCVLRCSAEAITLQEGKAVVKQEKCRLCGYCAGVCKDFCIKVI